jgi:hypothetical protein
MKNAMLITLQVVLLGGCAVENLPTTQVSERPTVSTTGTEADSLISATEVSLDEATLRAGTACTTSNDCDPGSTCTFTTVDERGVCTPGAHNPEDGVTHCRCCMPRAGAFWCYPITCGSVCGIPGQ